MKPSDRICDIYMDMPDNNDTDENNFIQAIMDYLDEQYDETHKRPTL